MCPGVRIIYSPRISYMCQKKPKPKKRKEKKRLQIYNTKSKITTEKKRITNKNMRGVLQFSVYSVVLSLRVCVCSIYYFLFFLFFWAPIHGTVVDACQDNAGTIGWLYYCTVPVWCLAIMLPKNEINTFRYE